MTTNYPTTLDTNTELPVESASTPLSTNHIVNHTNVRDAIKALEAKVGVDGSAVTTTHDYKLSGVTGSDKAVSKTGTEDLTNKTLKSGTKIGIGSDATGDIYYNGGSGVLTRLPVSTDGKILKLSSGLPSWQTETVTNDASTTVKGIVEIATDAELASGTSTGSTGAILVAAASSVGTAGVANKLVQYDGSGKLPAVDGSQLTNMVKTGKIYTDVVTAGTSVTNTTTTLYTSTINANTFIANSRMILYVSYNISSTSGSTPATTLNVKYGGTTICTKTTGTSTSGDYILRLDVLFGATSGTADITSTLLKNTGGTTTTTTEIARASATASLTSNQTFLIEAITVPNATLTYYASSMQIN